MGATNIYIYIYLQEVIYEHSSEKEICSEIYSEMG